MTRPFFLELQAMRKAIERIEGRRVVEIGLAEVAFKGVLEELDFDKTTKEFSLYGVRVIESFDTVVSFILEDRTTAEARAKDSPPHKHAWRRDDHRGATGQVCDCGATR